MPVLHLTITFFIAAMSTYVLTPVVRKVAYRWKVGDKPNGRKIHGSAIPHLGGVAIFVGVLGAFLYAVLVLPNPYSGSDDFLAAFLSAAAVLLILGLVDDVTSLSPRQKMIVQSFAACLVPIFGVVIPLDFLFGDLIVAYIASFLFTYFWFVGASCAFNLIDGMDGLASGLASISAAAFAAASLLQGEIVPLVLALTVLGASLAFLRHNFYPAKIFMGDTGSLFLGFVLAFIACLLAGTGHSLHVLLGSLLIMAVPILDTLLAIVRRAASRHPVFLPDASHIHHKLLEQGHGQRSVAGILYAVQALLAVFGVLVIAGYMLFFFCGLAATAAFFAYGLILMIRPAPKSRPTAFEGATAATFASVERHDSM